MFSVRRTLLVVGFVAALVPSLQAQKPKPSESSTLDSSRLTIGAASFDAGSQELRIHGANFGSARGVVSLNGFPLPVMTWEDTAIRALLSDATPPGSYLLIVSRGHSTPQFDTFAVTIGAAGPKGETGDAGPQGEPGEPGPQGEPGPPGPQGDRGDKGDKGDRGEVGPVGPQGDRGEKGEKGDKGDRGEVGPQGETGLKGDRGDVGAQGERGEQGPQGEPGSPGAPGTPGAPGAPGAKGDPGDVGPPGPQGLPGILGLVGKSCPDGQVLKGFDAEGDLVCVSLTSSPNLRTTVGLCGFSFYDVANFVPATSGLTLAQTCTPSDDMQALFVTRFLSDVDTTALQAYLDNGGIVITDFMKSHDVYNQVFGTSFPVPDFADRLGNDLHNVNPFAQLTPADAFWTANAPFTQETNVGSGLNLYGLPGITPLGSHVATANTVTLAYIKKNAGRLWLVESDWSMAMSEDSLSPASVQLMRYMVMNR